MNPSSSQPQDAPAMFVDSESDMKLAFDAEENMHMLPHTSLCTYNTKKSALLRDHMCGSGSFACNHCSQLQSAFGEHSLQIM